MRDRYYPILATAITVAAMLAIVLLSGCGTVSVGDMNITPAQRCVGYTAGVARYERILEEEGSLNDAQQIAYDVAIAGQLATCLVAD